MCKLKLALSILLQAFSIACKEFRHKANISLASVELSRITFVSKSTKLSKIFTAAWASATALCKRGFSSTMFAAATSSGNSCPPIGP